MKYTIKTVRDGSVLWTGVAYNRDEACQQAGITESCLWNNVYRIQEDN